MFNIICLNFSTKHTDIYNAYKNHNLSSATFKKYNVISVEEMP